jgi:hypothetical protein
LSARYSSSPALRLRIGNSRLRSVLYGALCLVTAYALWELQARAEAFVCALLVPLAASLLWRMRRDPMVGVELCWRRGVWTLEQSGVQRVIIPTRRSTATPWVIYLAYTDPLAGGAGHCWLYADCACAQQLRRLRVRLTVLG